MISASPARATNISRVGQDFSKRTKVQDAVVLPRGLRKFFKTHLVIPNNNAFLIYHCTIFLRITNLHFVERADELF